MTTFDKTLEQMKVYLKELIEIPSPSGYCQEIMAYIERRVRELGYPFEQNRKGGGIITIEGEQERVIGLTAHVDTLGAMVRSIKPSGHIRFTTVGGYTMESIEGAYCKIHTRKGTVYEGTALTTKPSVHVYEDARELKRIESSMEIRIDESVTSKEEVEALGIAVGDYISFDPQLRMLKNGFIKSRHLDDKAGVAIILGYLYHLKNEGKQPTNTLKCLISNYEEVGFGASYIPEDIEELIAIDMGAIGDDLTGSEKKVSICAKDSSGPYDYERITTLIEIAEAQKLAYAVDIFPRYSSDVSAAVAAGHNIRGILIGPGIHASHGMERTHCQSLINTLKLLYFYLDN